MMATSTLIRMPCHDLLKRVCVQLNCSPPKYYPANASSSRINVAISVPPDNKEHTFTSCRFSQTELASNDAARKAIRCLARMFNALIEDITFLTQEREDHDSNCLNLKRLEYVNAGLGLQVTYSSEKSLATRDLYQRVIPIDFQLILSLVTDILKVRVSDIVTVEHSPRTATSILTLQRSSDLPKLTRFRSDSGLSPDLSKQDVAKKAILFLFDLYDFEIEDVNYDPVKNQLHKEYTAQKRQNYFEAKNKFEKLLTTIGSQGPGSVHLGQCSTSQAPSKVVMATSAFIRMPCHDLLKRVCVQLGCSPPVYFPVNASRTRISVDVSIPPNSEERRSTSCRFYRTELASNDAARKAIKGLAEMFNALIEDITFLAQEIEDHYSNCLDLKRLEYVNAELGIPMPYSSEESLFTRDLYRWVIPVDFCLILSLVTDNLGVRVSYIVTVEHSLRTATSILALQSSNILRKAKCFRSEPGLTADLSRQNVAKQAILFLFNVYNFEVEDVNYDPIKAQLHTKYTSQKRQNYFDAKEKFENLLAMVRSQGPGSVHREQCSTFRTPSKVVRPVATKNKGVLLGDNNLPSVKYKELVLPRSRSAFSASLDSPLSLGNLPPKKRPQLRRVPILPRPVDEGPSTDLCLSIATTQELTPYVE